MNRREFLIGAGAAVGAAVGTGLTGGLAGGWPGTGRGAWRGTALGQPAQPTPRVLPDVPQPATPAWRGFNLLERFSIDWTGFNPFRESDFEIIREWGFNFVRLPLDYRYWGSWDNPREIREADINVIDDAVALGRRYGVHVCINFHRAPGYCVNEPREPRDLFTDPEMMDACALHWAHFARRYRDHPAEAVSFNLLNEPRAEVAPADYERFARIMAATIRAESPHRPIIADGVRWGTAPAWELWNLAVVQSGRGYLPFGLTHYRAGWVRGSDTWSVPTWPGDGWDAARLEREAIAPWLEYQQAGGAVHIGEFGSYRHTAHDVVLRWMRDLVGLWRRNGWGYALWNLRGAFGVLDSDRPDVAYEDFRGMRLDRQMLEILRG